MLCPLFVDSVEELCQEQSARQTFTLSLKVVLKTESLCPSRIRMLKPKFPTWCYLEVGPLGPD